MLGVVPWPELSQTAPLTQATRVAFPGGLAGIAVTVVTLGALLATASSANASILASARINFAMGRDRIVTNWLNEIHPSYATPYRSILVTGAMIVVFITLLGQDIEVLAKAASVLHLVVYALMNAALIVFRVRRPTRTPPLGDVRRRSTGVVLRVCTSSNREPGAPRPTRSEPARGVSPSRGQRSSDRCSGRRRWRTRHPDDDGCALQSSDGTRAYHVSGGAREERWRTAPCDSRYSSTRPDVAYSRR